MSLNQSELQRIKHELGINQLNVGAEPYVGITRYFEQIVLPNLNAGASTTSSTTVTATSPATPVAVALTVASATGISVFDRVFVDVDDALEEATVSDVTGSVITVRLQKAHSGTYPVVVEGGEALVRLWLSRCRRISERIDRFGSRAGVKKVDEIELFGGAGRGGNEPNGFKSLGEMQQYSRSELCKLLFGVGDVRSLNTSGSGGRIAVY